MLLTIDAGNTDTLFALFDGEGAVAGRWRLSTNAKRTADEYGMFARFFLDKAGLTPGQVTGICISCVVPAALHAMERAARRDFGLTAEPVILGREDVKPGIRIATDYPEEVGADRIANALAVHAEQPRNAVIVDFGTATTLDVIDCQGTYHGGVIAPGVQISMKSLHAAAARLPEIAFAKPPAVIGKNTVSALTSGMFFGYLSMIEGLITRITEERGGEIEAVIATGGLAGQFAAAGTCITAYEPDLTIRGLYHLYRLNRAG